MKPLRADHPPLPPVPHPISGVLDCPADLPWRELVEAALRNGWATDGLQAEAPDATVADLLIRRQPRPVVWGCGLLAERCCRIVVDRGEDGGYTSIRAPRKASGPDWAYLFVGQGGSGSAVASGRLVEASIALVRPAESYLLLEAGYETPAELFEAARTLARLVPFSTRRLRWSKRRLAAAVPVPQGMAGVLRERLVALGASLERTTGFPEELFFRPSFSPRGPSLVVSGAYDCVAGIVGAVESAAPKAAHVTLRYPDTHGVSAEVIVDPPDAAALDAGWELVLAAGSELHDAWRRDPEGEISWLAQPVHLESEAL